MAKESDIKGFGEILLLVWNEFKNDAVETHRMITAMLKLNVEMENSWLKTNVMTLSHQCLPKDFMTVLIKWHTCNACYMIALLMNLDLLCLGLLNLSNLSNLSIYLSICKLENEAILRDFLNV